MRIKSNRREQGTVKNQRKKKMRNEHENWKVKLTEATKKLPKELCAVLHIFNYDNEMRAKTLPHVDIERCSISWPKIWRNDFGGGHAAAILWAQSIWFDRINSIEDPFDRAFAMDASLQRAIIEALEILWGLNQ